MNPFTYKIGQRIRTADRITVLIVVVSLLLLVVASYGAWHVKQLQDRSEAMLSRNVESIRAAVELELHIQELRHQLDLYLWRHNLSDLGETKFTDLKAFKTERADIDVWLHRAEESAHTRKEEKLISQVHDGLGKFYRHLEKLAAAQNLDAERIALAETAESILAEDVLPPAREYLSADETLLEANRVEAASQSHRLARMLLFLGVFGSLAALAAGYAIARTIHKSLVELHIPMQDVAGKLSEVAGNVVLSTKFDLDDLGPALQRVSSEVTEVVEQLHARHRDIVRAEQLASLGQLAAGLAHEIRNPLMAMKMLVQAAQQQQGAGGLDGRDLQILDDEIRRLEQLLTEFLDFAKPTPLKQAIVDVRGIVESTVDFVQRQADGRQVTLHCDLPAEPVMLQIDAPRIRQVLLNLIINGIHAAPTGGNVWISVEPTEGRRPGYRIKVADDGAGIGPRQATRVFEPFYSTKETGLGLGLAVSQRIIRSHGGELALGRGDYSGAVFVIDLPLPDEGATTEGAAEETAKAT